MDAEFWHKRWKANDIGFHLGQANPALVHYFKEHKLERGGRVFVPMCGKTRDIAWLLDNGYRVAGAELSPTASKQLFKELAISPETSVAAGLTHYAAQNIDIFVGDIFDLAADRLGPVDAIYDRAALVALPAEMRLRYTAHLRSITNNAPQLLLSFEYDQRLMEGPPFSVNAEEIQRHYGDRYHLTLLESTDIDGGMKGICPAREQIWLLQNKR
ncbi:MAG: thiopurine S-methyltransferase [Candidatus Omnitrophica bacterium]|nr:thiopurine S-methyltransferase [Candidatus Omnitrophota bacterium]